MMTVEAMLLFLLSLFSILFSLIIGAAVVTTDDPLYYGTRVSVQINGRAVYIPVCNPGLDDERLKACKALVGYDALPELAALQFCRERKIAPIDGVLCTTLIGEEMQASLFRHKRRALRALSHYDPIVDVSLGLFISQIAASSESPIQVTDLGCNGAFLLYGNRTSPINARISCVSSKAFDPLLVPDDGGNNSEECGEEMGGPPLLRVISNTAFADFWSKDVLFSKTVARLFSKRAECALLPRSLWNAIQEIPDIRVPFSISQKYSIDGRTGAVDFVLTCRQHARVQRASHQQGDLQLSKKILRHHYSSRFGVCMDAIASSVAFSEISGDAECGFDDDDAFSSLQTSSSLPVYVAHYTKLTDRLKDMACTLQSAGLRSRASVITSFDKEELKQTPDLSCAFSDAYAQMQWIGRTTKLGENSLSLKHLAALLDVYENQHRAALVLEDDAVFASATPHSWNAYTNLLYSELQRIPFDLVMVGTCSGAHPAKDMDEHLTKHLWRALEATCSHAYIVSLSGAAKLLKSLPLRGPFDFHINYVAEMDKTFTMLRTHPSMVGQAHKGDPETVRDNDASILSSRAKREEASFDRAHLAIQVSIDGSLRELVWRVGEAAKNAAARFVSFHGLDAQAAKQIQERLVQTEAARFENPKKYAIISSNENPTYAFFLPLTCIFWKSAGYEPVVLTVGEKSRWECNLLKTVLVALDELNVKRFHLTADRTSSVTMAQVARLYAAWLPGMTAHDYIITSDADTWPIGPNAKRHFNDERNWKARVHLYNAFCCGDIKIPLRVSLPGCARGSPCKEKQVSLPTRMYPMGYIGMRVRDWRDVMGGNERLKVDGWDLGELGGVIEDEILRQAKVWRFDAAAAGKKADDSSQWFADQYLFSQRIALWDAHPAHSEQIPRRTEIDRIDRAAWPPPHDLLRKDTSQIIDAHLLLPAHTQWERVEPLLRVHFSTDSDHDEQIRGWMREYHASFLDAFLR